MSLLQCSFKTIKIHHSRLKGLCHEDTAVLGQFCAEVITYFSAFTHTQNAAEGLRRRYNTTFIRENYLILSMIFTDVVFEPTFS